MNILEVYIKNIYVWTANTTQYGRGLVPQKDNSIWKRINATKHSIFDFRVRIQQLTSDFLPDFFLQLICEFIPSLLNLFARVALILFHITACGQSN